MRNFRNFADMLQNFPVDESPGQPPMSSAMPDELALAAQQEALEQPHVMPDALNKAAQQEAIQQAVVAKPAPAPQSGVNRQGLDQAMANFKGVTPEGTMAKTGPGVGRAPAVEGAAEPESEMSRLEKLMQQMNAQRKQEMEDAASRQMKTQMLKGITDNLGLLMAGSQAMNTKAGVQAPQVKSIDVGDLVGQVERKFKPEQEQLLAEYKTLKDANKPMTEYQQQMLDHMRNQLALSEKRDANAMTRFYGTDGRLREKQEWTEKEKDEVSDKQSDALASYSDTQAAFERIRKAKKGIDTGPVANLRNRAASVVGMDDPDVTSLRSELIDTLAQKIKALSGTAANESEVNRLKVTLPEMSDSDEVFARKLKDAEKRVEEAKAIRIDHYKKQGKDPSRFENKKETSETKTINGVTYKKVPGGWQKVK